jgi:hypothetical protein
VGDLRHQRRQEKLKFFSAIDRPRFGSVPERGFFIPHSLRDRGDRQKENKRNATAQWKTRNGGKYKTTPVL